MELPVMDGDALAGEPDRAPPRRAHPLLAVGLVVLVLFATGIGAGVGISAERGGSRPSAGTQRRLRPPAGTDTRGGGGFSVSAIASEVGPAVVDVNSTLGLQGAEAAGTGMVLTAEGEVLTNNHVVEGATAITVTISGRSHTYPARVLGTDRTDDVALLQVEGVSGLKTVRLGDSSRVAVGEPVVAIGNASNLPGPPSVTDGTVTALDRSITAQDDINGPEELSGLIQSNAPLRPGDSGGPLVNASGQTIGMNTAASRGFRFSSGSSVGFAIPINQAVSIVRQIEGGSGGGNIQIGRRGFLGVEVRDLDARGSGALVTGVVSGGPAQSAGIVKGDVIVSIDSKPVDTASTLTRLLTGHHPADSLGVGWVDQAGRHRRAVVRLGEGPAA
jgi:S1-C subfamily serine protease